MDYGDIDVIVAQLQYRLCNLQDQLGALRSSCDDARRKHASAFSRSLHLSILEATALVSCVKRVDADLIQFHAGNASLRTMEITIRRWAGVLKTKKRMQEYHAQNAELQRLRAEAEKQTRCLVIEKERLIRKQLELVEAEFSRTADSLQLGQDRLADLNRTISSFSSNAIGTVTREAHQACSDLDAKQSAAQRQIKQHQRRIVPVIAQNAQAKLELEQTTQQRVQLEEKQRGHYAWAGLGMLGTLGAGVALAFMPVIPVVAVGAGALGSCIYNGSQGDKLKPDIDNTSKKVTEETDALGKAVVRLDSLNTELTTMNERHTAVTNAQSYAETLGGDAGKLRIDAFEIHMELHKARLGLAPAEQALRRLAEQLEDDGYVGSRNHIATELRKIFLALFETGMTCNKAFRRDWSEDLNFQVDCRLTEEAMRDINVIESETSDVLEVMTVGVTVPE